MRTLPPPEAQRRETMNNMARLRVARSCQVTLQHRVRGRKPCKTTPDDNGSGRRHVGEWSSRAIGCAVFIYISSGYIYIYTYEGKRPVARAAGPQVPHAASTTAAFERSLGGSNSRTAFGFIEDLNRVKGETKNETDNQRNFINNSRIKTFCKKPVCICGWKEGF
jgi:hypothetical protein